MRKLLPCVVLFAASTVWAKAPPIIDNPLQLTAKSWLVTDGDSKILAGKDTETVRSIASITKVITVLTVLEAGQDLDQLLPYSRALKLTRRELIDLAMVRSDNHASDLLCRHYPTGYKSCIEAMNATVRQHGMFNTTLVDATGLLAANTSNTQDLLKLLEVAEKNAIINETAKKTKVEIQLRKKWLIFRNTNPLIGQNHQFIVSKTGTTLAAGGCIILSAQTDRGLRRVVVLGSQNGRTRIPEAEFIVTRVN
jgi:D-alanyl-D-alanine endopeptidase (penicillin-binding protein 7)